MAIYAYKLYHNVKKTSRPYGNEKFTIAFEFTTYHTYLIFQYVSEVKQYEWLYKHSLISYIDGFN